MSRWLGARPLSASAWARRLFNQVATLTGAALDIDFTTRQVAPLELIANGGFDTTGSWLLKTPVGTESAVIGSGVLSLTHDGTNPAYADQGFPTVPGQSYTLYFTNTNTIWMSLGTNQGGSAVSNAGYSAGTRGFTFTAISQTTWVRFLRASAGTGTVDNVSCIASTFDQIPLVATNSSGGYADDSAGNWIWCGPNTLRRTDKGILVEEARTNRIVRSHELDNATAWVASAATITPKPGMLDPFGGTPYAIVDTSAVVPHGLSGATLTVTAGTTETYYAIAKAGARDFLRLSLNGAFSVTPQIWFNLRTGTVASVQSGTATIRPLSNGWYLCAWTFTPDLSGAAQPVLRAEDTTSTSYAGDGTEAIYVCHTQFEQGAFPTSPIRTTGVAMQRNADSITMAVGGWFNPAAGTMYVDFTRSGFNGAGSPYPLSVSGGAAGTVPPSMRFRSDTATGGLQFQVVDGASATQANIGIGSYGADVPVKAVGAWAQDNFAASANGIAPALDTVGNVSTGYTTLQVGSGAGGMAGFIRRATFYTSRLSDAALSAITQGQDPAWTLASASLDWDFVNGRYAGVALPSSLTVQRSSVGMAQKKDGSWVSFGNDTARITDQGLLIEEARTNGIRNSAMQGATVGDPGSSPTNMSIPSPGIQGLSRQVVGIGTEQGVEGIYVRFFGTTTGGGSVLTTLEGVGIIAAANGQTWTTSIFARITAGSLNGIQQFYFRQAERNASAQTANNNSAALAIDGTLRRFSTTATLAQADTASMTPQFGFNTIQAGDQVDVTFFIGWPQSEQGAFATSPIRTTGVAVQRNADMVRLASIPWFNANAGALYAEATPGYLPAGQNGLPTIVSFDDTTDNERIHLRRTDSASLAIGIIVDGGAVQANFSGFAAPTWSGLDSRKLAIAFAPNDVAMVENGGAANSDPTATLPTPTQLALGTSLSGASGRFWNGYIRRIAYAASRVSNAILQQWTS